MRVAVIVAALVLAMLGASVVMYRSIDLRTDPAVEAAVAGAFEDMKMGRGDALRARMTAEAATTITPDKLQTLRAYVPNEPPGRRRLVNFMTRSGADGTVMTVRYELSYLDGGMLYVASLRKAGGDAWRIESFNLQRASSAELRENQFTLAKSPGHLLFLILAILSPLTMLTAFVSVVCAPRFKRKWLWAIVALVGLCSFSLNWTTGQAEFQPIMLNLLGTGMMRLGYLGFSPWVLKFTLPVGGLLAFWRLARIRREATTPPPLDEAVAGA